MATRANIIIKCGWHEEYILYHHWDGYPEELGAELQALCDHLKNCRCDIVSLVNYLVKNNVLQELELEDRVDFVPDDGFELTDGLHGDIEYLYKIFLNPYATLGSLISVVCYEVKDYLESNRTFHRVLIPEAQRRYQFK